MPLVLAFAISDGWSQVAWVAGVFLTLELVLINIVEPLVYGRSAGLSPIAIILAALFWTLLWGPVGLLLATPLTVCVAVMGRYMPELGYLNVILGVEPVLSPPARFYQRLLAMDEDEAEDLAEDFANEKGLLALYDEMVIPALALAEQDRHAHTLEEQRERFIFDTVRGLVEYLEDRRTMEGEPTDEVTAKPKNVVHRPAPPVCILAARDEADHVAALVLARMLEAPGFNPQVTPYPRPAETLEQIEQKACKVVCISAVPPHAAAQAGQLCKRLKQRFPEVKVMVALWAAEGSDKLESRLREAGVDVVVTRLADAVEQLRELTIPRALAKQNPGQNPIPRRRARSEALVRMKTRLPLVALATAGVTLAAAIVALNFTYREKRIGQRIRRLYSAADPEFGRAMGVLLGPAIVGGNRVEALLQRRRDLPGDARGDPRRAQDASPSRPTSTGRATIGQAVRRRARRARARRRQGARAARLGRQQQDGRGAARRDGARRRRGAKVSPARAGTTSARMNNRTHRKLLVVDGKVGFTGGVGIADRVDRPRAGPGPLARHALPSSKARWSRRCRPCSSTTGSRRPATVLHGADYFPALERGGRRRARRCSAARRSGGSESMQLMYLLAITAAQRIDPPGERRTSCRTS